MVHGAWSVVVIGYGNELRGDDAIGVIVAQQVAAWDLPGVRSIATRQLTPELAEQLSGAGMAIFVDARPIEGSQGGATGEATAEWQPLAPCAGTPVLGHASDPQALLALALTLYGYAPPAWLLAVPALSFELGAPISPIGWRGIEAATRAIGDRLLHSLSLIALQQDGRIVIPKAQPPAVLP
jgi:hydrogenase maturation protease